MQELEINQQVADKICAAASWNGQQFRRGDAVALLDGNVVAVAPDLEGALKALRAVDPNPSRGMVFEVYPAAVDVIR